MKILIVEDQLEVLECLRSYSLSLGCEVMTATTAQEAIAMLDRITPDLAFVDLTLPQGNGRQVVYEIYRRGLPSRMVVVTACDDLDIRKDLMNHGVSDYLFKPITIHDLDQLLKAVPGTEAD